MNLRDASLYFNRELSWLKFNERVLEEAADLSHPLLERLKFLSIFSSNLDEFFMIRVAGLKEQLAAGIHEVPEDGLTPSETIDQIALKVHEDVRLHSRLLNEDVMPLLRKKGIRIRYYNTLTNEQKAELEVYFKEKVFPVLTPLAVDPSHPFPQLRNLGLNLLVELRDPAQKKERKIAVLPLPSLLNRFIPLSSKTKTDCLLLEDLVAPHLDMLFPNMLILSANCFRITRNADMDLSEAEADDLLKLIERELRKRRMGTLIRLEVSDKMPPENRKFLQVVTRLKETAIYDISGPLDVASFIHFLDLSFPELKDPAFTPSLHPRITKSPSIFSAICKQDILLHHPYDSFNHVIDLAQEAARDPQVLAIKVTLYRTSGKSPIVQALKEATAKGKQVTALIELKARFDEETNIVWAKELEHVGVNVIYGLLGLKTHCKLLMIVRQEEGQIRRYVHMSTGNYNARTSRIYTDIGLMTADESIGKDVSELFNLLTGYSGQREWRKLFVAPINLRDNLVKLIQQCIAHHSAEHPSHIQMVMNQLVDPQMIQTLYRASIKGVKVDLVVRGVCCLRPGVPGISENITVRSIVGRFLEHCRIFHFKYNGDQKIYMGSADLMQRNLNRRVEITFPLEDPEQQDRVLQILEVMFKDNVKARILQADGSFIRAQPRRNERVVNSQEYFLNQASERQKQIDTISKQD
ncbi:MAG TPA: polyphosphate kinase 1 [Bacteroidia bacterium]|nr:polyphosphate kinase 1 [Bacteroidia bacterium]